MNCSGDSEILHKIVCETTQISSWYSDFRVVSRTISCIIWESPLHVIFFLTLQQISPSYCEQSCVYKGDKRKENQEKSLAYGTLIAAEECTSMGRKSFKNKLLQVRGYLTTNYFVSNLCFLFMFVWKKGRSSILVNSTFESEPTLWIVLYGPVSYLPRHRVKMGPVVLVPNYRQGCLCSTQINDSTVNPPDNPFLMRQWRGKNCACPALYPKTFIILNQIMFLICYLIPWFDADSLCTCPSTADQSAAPPLPLQTSLCCVLLMCTLYSTHTNIYHQHHHTIK